MMDDLISRRDAINVVSEITTTMSVCTSKDECYGMKRMQKQAITELANLPSAEPEHPDINVGNMDDCISRKAAIGCLNNVSFDCSMDQEVVEEELLKLPPVHPTISKTENVDGAISRQQAIDALRAMQTYKLFAGDDMLLIDQAEAQTELMMLPSAQPEIIHCKDCVYQTESWSGIKYCEAHGDHIGKDYDYCSNARRKGDKAQQLQQL